MNAAEAQSLSWVQLQVMAAHFLGELPISGENEITATTVVPTGVTDNDTVEQGRRPPPRPTRTTQSSLATRRTWTDLLLDLFPSLHSQSCSHRSLELAITTPR